MTDPVTPRPELPDPQHDRYVAFPGDEPAGGSPDVAAADGAAAGAARGPVVGATLPPEAWAPLPVEPSAKPGSVLTTPPHSLYAPRPRRRSGSPGAKLLAGLVLVPVMLGFFSSGSHDEGYTGGSGTGVEMPMGGDLPMGDGSLGGVPGVWVDNQLDSPSVAAPLTGSPKVEPVPADTTSLRVEVVGDEGTTIDFQADANGIPIERTTGVLPYATEIHMDERPTTIQVTANISSPTVRLQCRVYAGETLVAIGNGTETAACSPAM